MITAADLSERKRLLLEGFLRGDGALRRRWGERVEPRQMGEVPPISAEQQDVWLHASMAPGLPLYNEAITIHRNGSFDLPAFEQSFNEILRRHEIWRTSFEMADGRLRQIVHPELRVKLELVDLTDLPEAEREKAALRIAAVDARKPFDLRKAPLLRARVLRLAQETHRIYVTLHHIIFDGVSIYRVVMPELSALYAAFAQGRRPNVPPPTLQYGDYALWRERRLAADASTGELDYWRHKLAGELPALRLPTDRQHPAVPSYQGAMETFSLSAELTAALKALSRQEGVTLYVTLLAAFKALLHRYSGQDDIVIGGVTDMRRHPELEGLVGYFLNSVALRTQPSAGTSFCEYLIEVRNAVLGALDASSVPFDRVVREVQPKRDSGRHPVFQVLFSIEPPAPAFAEGWDLTQMDVTVGTAKFDLYLELDERSDGIIGRFLYSSDLFDAPSIRRMIGHWTVLLEAVVEDRQCTLGRLPLLTPRETRRLLNDWNATERDYPRMTLHRWFEAQARRTPDAIAVEFDGRTWRYRELDRRATQLAARLRRAGVGRETLVAIAVDRSFEMLAGLLAILKAGGAYLPLDGYLPPARLAELLDDARPAVVLTERGLAARLPRCDVRIVLCDEVLGGADEAAEALDGAVDAESLAYVLYTSGSTGKPKAVEVSHRSLVNLLATLRREPGFGADDSLLAVTTLSFDIAALELFLPLVTGGRVIVATREEAADPFRLAALVDLSGCTVMQATPATWRGLLAAGWSGSKKLKILCGGEVLPPDLAAKLLRCGASLWNMYGPTETTIWSLLHKVGPGEEPVPIGRPVANTRIYVLDPNGRPVPAGVPGELYIGGAGVARGYRGDAALTEDRFVTLAALPGERLYRTGDVVRYRADGTVDWLGRTDNQVKVRGFRVGLEEIERMIALHPDIAAAAVRASPDGSGEMSLTAFVVDKTTPGRAIPGLPQFLRQRLPGYMVPARYVALLALPMTTNGKVDRNRLPEPEPIASLEVAEPRDELERKLVEIWKDLLGASSIGIHDNFFERGGHSLLAFMLVAEIGRVTGRDLPLATLFGSPTVASLAELLRSTEEPTFSHLVELQPEGSGRPLFIVHGIFGDVLQLKGLAERLRTDRPIYALQARGVDPRQEPHSTIAEMADAYVESLRVRQPAGPYALAGYSFGGLVAFEMACRLREYGESVDLLAMFEVDVHERNLPLPAWFAYQLALAKRVMQKMTEMPARQWPAYLLGKVSMVWRRLLLRLGLREPDDPSNEATGALSPRYQRMYQIGVREFIAFRPRPYAGRLSVFRGTEPRFDACDPLPIWRRVANAVDVYTIAGAHQTIMEEHCVESLARQLGRCLVDVDGALRQDVRYGRIQWSRDPPATVAGDAAALENGGH